RRAEDGAAKVERSLVSTGRLRHSPQSIVNWNSEYVSELVQRALAEDVGSGDATALATIPASAKGQAHIVTRQDLICAGLPLAEAVFRALDPEIKIEFRSKDSEAVAKGRDLLHLD